MWNSCAKFDRLKKALRYRGLDPDHLNLDELSQVLRKRGITDAQQNPLVWTLISVLEPPACTMNHCKSYGNSPSFCNCGKGLLPSKCTEYKKYKQRCKEREQKKSEDILQTIIDLAKERKGRIVTTDSIRAKLLEHKIDIRHKDHCNKVMPIFKRYFEPHPSGDGYIPREVPITEQDEAEQVVAKIAKEYDGRFVDKRDLSWMHRNRRIEIRIHPDNPIAWAEFLRYFQDREHWEGEQWTPRETPLERTATNTK